MRQALAGVEPVPVWLPREGPVAGALDQAVQAAAADGHPVKALLLTNPNNPLVRPHLAVKAPQVPAVVSVLPRKRVLRLLPMHTHGASY